MSYGIGNSYSSYESASVSTQYASNSKSGNVKEAEGKSNASAANTAYSGVAATYEKSNSASAVTNGKPADRSALIAQLKADSDNRIAQMQSLVSKMFEKQGITIGTADDMWKMLAKGDFTADEDTIAQAKEDISENGYWGVDQTSSRIFDFAMALSGGDEEKMKSMVSAVEKGFKEATKAWGKDLPDISNDTYSAVMNKFDDWFAQKGSSATTKDILGQN